MARVLSAIVYMLVFVPISAVRGISGWSRFGWRLHRAPTAWDKRLPPG
jgi:hypothetical protein